MNEMELTKLSQKLSKDWLYSAAVILNGELPAKTTKLELLKIIMETAEKDPSSAAFLMDFDMVGKIGKILSDHTSVTEKALKISEKEISEFKENFFNASPVAPIHSPQYRKSTEAFFRALSEEDYFEKILIKNREQTTEAIGAVFSAFLYWNIIHFFGVITPEHANDIYADLTESEGHDDEELNFLLYIIDHSFPGNIYLEEIDGTDYLLGGFELISHEEILELQKRSPYDMIPLLLEDITSMYMGVELELMAEFMEELNKYIKSGRKLRMENFVDMHLIAELVSYLKLPSYQDLLPRLKREFGFIRGGQEKMRQEIESFNMDSPKYEYSGYTTQEAELLSKMMTEYYDEADDDDYDFDFDDDKTEEDVSNVIDFNKEKKKRNKKFLN